MRAVLAASIVAAAAVAAAATFASTAPAATSIVAAAAGPSVAVYRYPNARRPFVVLRNPNGDGGALVFLVVQRLPGWERVRLPMRPNGSTGWVRDRAVTLSHDSYRLVVSLRAHTVTVWRAATKIRVVRAGVGRAALPTPPGRYYLAALLRQPDPAGPYGPYAFGLSAYSTVLRRFGAGPGQIGIHGTNEPATLGGDVSHGCIRVGNRDIVFLARLLPLGTPVRIVG